MSKNLNETVRFQSEKREKWIREIRGERQQEIAKGVSIALRLTNSSATSFSVRNECLGTHCSLIEQEEREVCPKYQIVRWERVKMSEKCTLMREAGIKVET